MNNNNTSDHVLDKRLKKILATELPQAPENKWFLRKVMNRLPNKKQTGRLGTAQKACYLTATLLLVGGWCASLFYTLKYGLTANTLIMAAIIPAIAIMCIGIMGIPAIKRALP